MLKNELDGGRPVLYSAADLNSTGGHNFILDGYENLSGTILFHFNWGWDGQYKDAYYTLDKLNPSTCNFQTWLAIVGLTPAVITGPDNVCNGQTTSFSINPLPNVSYSWSVVPTGFSITSNQNSVAIKAPLSGSGNFTISAKIIDNNISPWCSE